MASVMLGLSGSLVGSYRVLFRSPRHSRTRIEFVIVLSGTIFILIIMRLACTPRQRASCYAGGRVRCRCEPVLQLRVLTLYTLLREGAEFNKRVSQPIVS